MIKINPFNSKINQTQIKGQNNSPTFSAAATTHPVLPDTFQKTIFAPEWLNDSTIFQSVNYLNDVTFDTEDIKQVQSKGAVLPFLNGKDAVNFIKNSNIRIKFDTLPSPHVHAQYDFENNFIKINEIYKNTQDPAEILAIAGAILHEAGHAKDNDGHSSIQEEIDCLAMNALSHRFFVKKYPDIFSTADSLIVKDGVCVYADLFFNEDTEKLANRVKEKYGFLPVGDFKHSPSGLALKVKTS